MTQNQHKRNEKINKVNVYFVYLSGKYKKEIMESNKEFVFDRINGQVTKYNLE